MTNLNTSPMPCGPHPAAIQARTVRFHQWLMDRASEMRFKQTTGWIFLADEVERLAKEAQLFDCDSPEEFTDRREALERLNSVDRRRGE